MRRFRIFWNYQKIFINKKVSLTKFDFSCLDPASFQSTKLPTQHHPESGLWCISMGVRMIFCHGNHPRARGAHFLAFQSHLKPIRSRQPKVVVPASLQASPWQEINRAPFPLHGKPVWRRWSVEWFWTEKETESRLFLSLTFKLWFLRIHSSKEKRCHVFRFGVIWINNPQKTISDNFRVKFQFL